MYIHYYNHEKLLDKKESPKIERHLFMKQGLQCSVLMAEKGGGMASVMQQS